MCVFAAIWWLENYILFTYDYYAMNIDFYYFSKTKKKNKQKETRGNVLALLPGLWNKTCFAINIIYASSNFACSYKIVLPTKQAQLWKCRFLRKVHTSYLARGSFVERHWLLRACLTSAPRAWLLRKVSRTNGKVLQTNVILPNKQSTVVQIKERKM